MTTPALPSSTHAVGDPAHTSDHNAIATALNQAVYRSNNGTDFSDAGSTRANIHVPVLTPCACVATVNVPTRSGPGGATTIASGSNSAVLPQATINVASTTAFPSSGTINVVTGAGTQAVTYSGTTSTTFTGCTGGTGTMSTGGAITATFDGYLLAAGDQILLTAQSTASQNGAWVIPAGVSGAWSRPTDFATGVVVKARHVSIIEGTIYGATAWMLQTTSSITVDTDSQTWVNQFTRDYVNVRTFGAKGDGVTDDTSAITAAYTASHFVFFPAGNYLYNGAGLDLTYFGMAGVAGGGSGITLGASSFLFNCTGAQTSLTITDMFFSNGLGVYHSSYTGGNVYSSEFTISDCTFKHFTQCAIGHNAGDWPNWKIQRCFFIGNSPSAICVALDGLTDHCMVSDCGFGGTYLVGVKLGAGGNNAKLVNLDMTAGSVGTSNPAVSQIWVVPSTTINNAGGGLVIDKIKFGNEGLNPGVDYRIVYADQNTGTGTDFTTYPPALTAPSSGYIAGHRVLDVALNGSSGGGNPLVYSTTPTVQGCYYGPVISSGSVPSYILQFASVIMPLVGGKYNSTNIIGPVLLQTESSFGAGFDYCNVNAAAHIIDPVGGYQQGSNVTPFFGGGLNATGVTILSDAQASTFTGTATISAVTDGLGGTDAIQAVFGTTSQAVSLPSISSALVKTDRPLWIEFDLLNSNGSPVTDVYFQINESATQEHLLNVMVAPNSAGWMRYRYQTGMRSAAANLTVSFLPGVSATVGTVSIGRVRLYHAREPVPLDIAHAGHYVGFYGAVPVARPTVTGSQNANPAVASLISALANQGLITNSTSTGGLSSFAAGTFGAATDGSATLDGTATVAWATKSSSTYTMTRDVHATTLTINSGVTLVTNGFRLFAQTSVSNAGTVGTPGPSASGTTGGGGTGAGTLGGGRSGGGGVVGAGTTNGTAGTFTGSGAGGAGSGNAGGTGNTAIVGNTNMLSVPTYCLMGGILYGAVFTAIQGGSGGASGGGDGTNKGGGGGGGGPFIAVLTPTFTNTGTVTVAGGNGGTPSTGNCGGGSGGGGGVFVVYTTNSATMGTVTTTAGTAGSGVGTGSAASASTAGISLNVVLS